MSCMDKDETTPRSIVDLDLPQNLAHLPIIPSAFLNNLKFQSFDYHQPGTLSGFSTINRGDTTYLRMRTRMRTRKTTMTKSRMWTRTMPITSTACCCSNKHGYLHPQWKEYEWYTAIIFKDTAATEVLLHSTLKCFRVVIIHLLNKLWHESLDSCVGL